MKQHKYKISIMIITYNRKHELLRALKSCLNVKIEEMEIVILDNNSTDGTQEVVEKYLTENNISYIYHYSNENLGISLGRNMAFRLCSGEIIFCLDDDAVIETEDFFQKLYIQMMQDRVVAAAVKIYEPKAKRYLKGYLYKKNEKKYVLSYIGAGHALNRSFFEGKDLYPSTLRFGSEEYYIAYRIRKENKKIAYYDNLLIYHLPSSTARVRGKERDINIIVNNYIIRRLCFPKITIPLIFFMFCIRIAKHGFITPTYINLIQEMISERYCEKYLDRMSIKNWLEMCLDTSLFQLI